MRIDFSLFIINQNKYISIKIIYNMRTVISKKKKKVMKTLVILKIHINIYS